MERFADELRAERERQGISLGKISAVTKVSERHLRELEAGDFGSLPGGVFRKGILRSYLAVLQLDPEPWVRRFEECLRAMEQMPAESSEGIAVFAENISRGRGEAPRAPARWPGVVGMLLLLLVFGWAVWRFALRGRVVVTHLHHPVTQGAAQIAPPA